MTHTIRCLIAILALATFPLAEAAVPTLVNITPYPGSVTNLTSVTVEFSEPVQGVNAGDLWINAAKATSMTGSGKTYTFNFAQPEFGSAQFYWDLDHGITDFS